MRMSPGLCDTSCQERVALTPSGKKNLLERSHQTLPGWVGRAQGSALSPLYHSVPFTCSHALVCMCPKPT
jgi:hypothetical protein